MTEYQTLRTHSESGVLFAEIDSPPMNLIGPALIQDIVTLIPKLEAEDGPRVVVFSSADPDFFIPHVDMTKIAEYRQVAATLVGEPSIGLLFRRLSLSKAVTIAQISGRARGAGSEFALACDMRFASRERAIFGQIESGFGLSPGAGAIQHLTRLMGRGRALEALLSSNDFDADTAERYGWINRALPESELAPFVAALAKRIARFPPAGIMAIKERVSAIDLASEADFRRDSDLFGAGAQNPETKQRISAIAKSGMQTRGDTELNFGRLLGEISD
ncbi:enoyl-CoA hydratase/carnithine racemase [Phyllobacterium sp. 1468]|uniref:enoyl-CoA hydratase/isomerase family protein n=1 Tax=Phyllobacterium sp. 1468 TaxID=2817759 RepID=UPI00285E8757|nr:enoyl-CoA hydratase/isomerase family protein [Phyllobacterium sp. 1468]MDR6632609.1 enoyl-CoA hydratase/carnithine racemase [Phyllobacterium sp. 1468]